MNSLEKHLSKIDSNLYNKFLETKAEVNLLLGKYSSNFPSYTDHSINHTMEVFLIASELLSEEELENLNADETYILSMACILHDIGMCIPLERIKDIPGSEKFAKYRESHSSLSDEDFIRDIHHELSNNFILEEWEILKIHSLKYAKAIGLVSEGHRKVDIGNFEVYEPQFFAKSGKEFVCLPYLASVLRIADELDVTNSRTPKILTKYYLPNNERSIMEWSKHIATLQRNYLDNTVIFEVNCSDHSIYAALQEQFDKIQGAINQCQKVIRSIPNNKIRDFKLTLSKVDVKYNFLGFDPKGIRFSFDVQNVVTAFIGEDLYKDKLTSVREALQNSIDSCRFKTLNDTKYSPKISIEVDNDYIKIVDNGSGMDEFIIEHFFGRLASSFYEQEKIKSQFEAIGQFGVGVFSYFLIGEYVDIETKTNKTETIKFRFDKDPNSYFHFYDKTERKDEGTSITIYLKNSLVGLINYDDIEKYIKKVFRHVEIPIEIISSGGSLNTLHEDIGFKIDPVKEIKERLKLHNRKYSDKYTLEIAKIDSPELKGCCALIINKNEKNPFQIDAYHFDSDQFGKSVSRHSLSQIAISQKGIYVNDYESFSIELIIGDFDICRKIKIGIDRNDFSDRKAILSLIHQFESTLMSNVFKNLELAYENENEKIVATTDFLINYLSNRSYKSDVFSVEFKNLLLDYIYVKVFFQSEYRVLNLRSVKEQFNEIILLNFKEDIEGVSEHFNIPTIICYGSSIIGSYTEISGILNYILNYTSKIVFREEQAHELFNTDVDPEYDKNLRKIKSLSGFSYYDLIKSESSKLCFYLWKNKKTFDKRIYDDIIFNYNHPIFQLIIKNYDKINTKKEYVKIIKTLFDLISEIYEGKTTIKKINQLNDILNPLSVIFTPYILTKNDFE